MLKILIASIAGNALEFYNLLLFSSCYQIIAKLFLPQQDAFISILHTWGIWAVGFLSRPIGALIFGAIGDKYGRKVALRWSIMGISYGGLLIAFVPDYNSIGIAAPAVLILARIIQGACAGGEFNGAIIFAIEHIKIRPGLTAGIITGSALIGGILANWAHQVIADFEIKSYLALWRILFLLGGLLGLMLLHLRNIIPETPEFLSQTKDCETKITWEHIGKYKKAITCLFALACMDGVMTYIMYGFSLPYLNMLGFSMNSSANALSIAIILYISSSVIGGFLSDIMPKHIYFTSITILVAVLSYISFVFMNSGFIYAQSIMGLAAGFLCSSINAFAQTMFPINIRYRLISFTYCTGIAIAGGFTPLLMLFLIKKTNNMMLPVYLIASMAIFVLLSLLIYRRSVSES